MLRAIRFDPDGREETVDLDASPGVAPASGAGSPGPLWWIDAHSADPSALAALAESLGIHPLAVEDAHKRGQRAKLETYPSHAVAVVFTGELAEIHLLIGDGWVLTVRSDDRRGRAWSPEAAVNRFRRGGNEARSVGLLVYALLDDIVDTWFDRIDDAEDTLERIEEQVFRESPEEERVIQQELFDVRRQLVLARRALVPMREVVGGMIRGEVPQVEGRAVVLLGDVEDHVLRATELLDAQRELMGNVVEAHLAIISNQINTVMKKVTSWGAVLFGASLIAGIYGMNFHSMPELDWRFGYPAALGSMLLLTAVLVVVFRRKRWL